MPKITDINLNSLPELTKQIKDDLTDSTNLEEATQKFIQIIYEKFKESIVLARVFITLNYKDIPEDYQHFVKSQLKLKDLSLNINPETPVLSLLSTIGENSDWNNRSNSKSHLAIPLISKEFIDEIPMVSRMLSELGASIEWINNDHKDIDLIKSGKLSGLFFVKDARHEVDSLGRKIISAQNFVSEYNIKTVFAIGGGYLIDKKFIVAIFFTREDLKKSDVEIFLPLINGLKAMTVKHISRNKLFKA